MNELYENADLFVIFFLQFFNNLKFRYFIEINDIYSDVY